MLSRCEVSLVDLGDHAGKKLIKSSGGFGSIIFSGAVRFQGPVISWNGLKMTVRVDAVT